MLGAASALYHSGKGDDSKIPKKINAKEEMAENDKKKKKKRIENAKRKREKDEEERRQRLEAEIKRKDNAFAFKMSKKIDLKQIVENNKREKMRLEQERTGERNPSPSTSQTEVSSRETNINDDEDENESYSEVETESEIDDRSSTPVNEPLNPNLLENYRLQNDAVINVPPKDRTFKRCVYTGVAAIIILFCIGLALGILVGSGGKYEFENKSFKISFQMFKKTFF